MVNGFHFMELDEVETSRDRVHYITQECTSYGLVTSLYTYLGGIVGIPLLLKSVHKRIPVPLEYKVAIGATFSMVVSYYAGMHAKKKCEEDIKKQLDEKLGPL